MEAAFLSHTRDNGTVELTIAATPYMDRTSPTQVEERPRTRTALQRRAVTQSNCLKPFHGRPDVASK